MDSEHARKLIVSERARIEGLIRDREDETGIGTESETGSISEPAPNDKHQGDIGTETFEREKDFSLLEQLEAEISDLDAALRKIDEGTYGRCEVCGKEIEQERLEGMAGTRTWREHGGAR